MQFLIPLAAILAFGAAFPRASNVLAWILTLAFIVPFFTLAVGLLAFAAHVVFFGGAASWNGFWSDTLMMGLPFGALLGIFILKD